MSLSPDNHNLFPPTRYSIAADPNRTPTKAAVVLEPMTSVMGAPVPPLTTLAEVGAEGGAYGWAREDASLETGIIPAPPPPPGPGPGFGQSHAFPPGTLPSAYASFNAAGPSSTSSAQGLSNFAAAAGVYLPNEAGQTPSPSGYGTGWRASLFGGKTLNRFSTYVTSGAEDFVLTGAEGVQPPVPPHREKLRNVMGHRYSAGSDGVDGDEDGTAGEADRHYIVSGTAGPKWKSKAPPFYVRVHSPEKRTKMSGMQEYTVFSVTSTFPAEAGVGNTLNDDSNGDGDGDTLSWGLPYDPTRPPSSAGPQLTVLRRFSQFAWLAQVLSRRFPALVLPSLPEKQYSGRFANEFVETRRADLELWIGRVVRHPVVRYSEVLLFFLGCEDEMVSVESSLFLWFESAPFGSAS